MMKHSYWEANFPGVGEVFLQAFGKPTPEEWEKMDNKQRIEAVSNVWREQKDFEKQAMGYQLQAVLLKRDKLNSDLEKCRWLRDRLVDQLSHSEPMIYGAELHGCMESLKKVIEFIECIDEP